MRLYLVRHAQTEWNVAGRAQGAIDIELDEEGHAQARALGSRLAEVEIAAIHTSDLLRSAQTAEAIAASHNLESVRDERLRERSLGDWEGRPFDAFREELYTLAGPSDPLAIHVRPPGGESLADVWERLRPLSRQFLQTDAPCLIVSHGAACALLLAQLLGASIEVSRRFRFANTGLTELERSQSELFHLVGYNCTRHLREEPLSGSAEGVHASCKI